MQLASSIVCLFAFTGAYILTRIYGGRASKVDIDGKEKIMSRVEIELQSELAEKKPLNPHVLKPLVDKSSVRPSGRLAD